jgi:regulator of protease activity HflC (stomatin/prohibitin superfamily)
VRKRTLNKKSRHVALATWKKRAAVTQALAEKQKMWGFTLTNFDLQSIDPPEAVVAATTASVVAARHAEQQRRCEDAECALAEQRALAKKRLCEIENESAAVAARGRAERELLEATQHARCTLVAAEATEKAAAMRNATRANAFGAMRTAGLSESVIIDLSAAKAWRAVAKRQTTTLVVPYESARYLGARLAIQDAQ